MVEEYRARADEHRANALKLAEMARNGATFPPNAAEKLRAALAADLEAWREEFEIGRKEWHEARDRWLAGRETMTAEQLAVLRAEWFAARDAWIANQRSWASNRGR